MTTFTRQCMITDRYNVQSYLISFIPRWYLIIWLALVWNTIDCSTVLIHKSYYVSLTNVFPFYKGNIDQTLIFRDTVLLFMQDLNTTSSSSEIAAAYIHYALVPHHV